MKRELKEISLMNLDSNILHKTSRRQNWQCLKSFIYYDQAGMQD